MQGRGQSRPRCGQACAKSEARGNVRGCSKKRCPKDQRSCQTRSGHRRSEAGYLPADEQCPPRFLDAGSGVPRKVAAATPASVEDRNPAGAIAQCKDGSYSHAKARTGACSRHGGVAKWG